MKSRDLQINEVTISTVSVDIQVMRIGAKQMTLAVFRQLRHKDIFDECGNLLAPPWGWVNYDCDLGRQPFVFSHDGILYRSFVDIQQHHELRVEAEILTEWESAHFDQHTFEYVQRRQIKTPTGKWLIRSLERHAQSVYVFELSFDSEADARVHLENRQRSIAVLEAAPQLFIAV